MEEKIILKSVKTFEGFEKIEDIVTSPNSGSLGCYEYRSREHNFSRLRFIWLLHHCVRSVFLMENNNIVKNLKETETFESFEEIEDIVTSAWSGTVGCCG